MSTSLPRLIPNSIILSSTCLRSTFHNITIVSRRYGSNSTSRPLRPATDDDRRRIYIMGSSPQAKFIAHALASLPNPPPITFLAFKLDQFSDFELQGGKLTMKYQARNFEKSVVSGVGMEVVSAVLSDISLSKGGLRRVMKSGVRLVTTLDPLDERDRKYLNNSPDRIESDVHDGGSLSDESFQGPNYDGRLRRLLLADTEMRPIYNLICSVRDHLLLKCIEEITYRLAQDSSIMIESRSIGLMEELTKRFSGEACPPSFFTMSLKLSLANTPDNWHNVSSVALPIRGERVIKYQKDFTAGPKAIDSNVEEETHSTKLYTTMVGALMIEGSGLHYTDYPMVSASRASRQSAARRQNCSYYMLQLLRNAFNNQSLGVYSHAWDDLQTRINTLKSVISFEVLLLVSIEFECKWTELLETKERRKLIIKLMVEAFNALKEDLPVGVDLNVLAKWISIYHKKFTVGSFPSALIDIANGHTELYDVLWVINRGKRSRPPAYCPEHERIVQLAKDRAKIQKERDTERLEKEYADRTQERRNAKFGI
ncbi:hypothetical protein EAF04_008489 [Stromatinia cepivora]|nr:hypothetical protein EAF04_008489 [Stromatinia cepivora]